MSDDIGCGGCAGFMVAGLIALALFGLVLTLGFDFLVWLFTA